MPAQRLDAVEPGVRGKSTETGERLLVPAGTVEGRLRRRAPAVSGGV